MDWLKHYENEIRMAVAGIAEQRTVIYVAKLEIERAERRIKEYEKTIARRRELLESEVHE
jgi:peptidoglycan hydrolase CwlO-like protein